MIATTPCPAPVLDTADLILAVRAGDRHAFRELHRRYSSFAYKVAIRKTPNPADAEDVVSCAWVEVWRSIDLAPEARFAAFLGCIVRRVGIRHYWLKGGKKGSTRRLAGPAADIDDPDVRGELPPQESPEAAYESAEVAAGVQAAIAGLSERHQHVVRATLAETTMTDVGQDLGKTRQTACARLDQAKGLLRVRLAHLAA